MSHKELSIKQLILGHSTSKLEGQDSNSSRFSIVTLKCVVMLALESPFSYLFQSLLHWI